MFDTDNDPDMMKYISSPKSPLRKNKIKTGVKLSNQAKKQNFEIQKAQAPGVYLLLRRADSGDEFLVDEAEGGGPQAHEYGNTPDGQ